VRQELDVNFAVTVDESYWRQRIGVGRLTWGDHPLLNDTTFQKLVPLKSVTFRGPQVAVSEPAAADDVVVRLSPEGWQKPPLPAIVARKFGKGRVVYCPVALDAGLWSYAYPYQRRLLARAVEWAARTPAPITVTAPMCVQTSAYTQADGNGRRTIVHLFNGMNTTANHGLPAMDVPLREEVVPIHGIRVQFREGTFRQFHLEPGNRTVSVTREGATTTVLVPPLEIHAMLVAESA
jgi:hypothetical protein